MNEETLGHTLTTNARSVDGDDIRPARLFLVEGPDAPRSVTIPVAGLTIGSGEESELQLSDRRVSRTHLRIVPTAAGFRVRDLGSRNGTFVGTARIEDGVVPSLSVLSLGRTKARLVTSERYIHLPPSELQSFGELIGGSLPMRELYAVLERVTKTRMSILVQGETGTGKEVVARSIHLKGQRANKPFIAIDCGAIPANLAESEFFGHTRGAFTGAVDNRPGAFERADGGTLFLDEIGELPMELQPKLLRALESQEIRRVGGSEVRRVDVQVLAGTNRDLREMVNEGEFRADLYYRLAVVLVHVPPLRDRLSDLPALITKLLADSDIKNAGPIEGANLDLLTGYDWPGNVRELRNTLQRAFAGAGMDAKFRDVSFHLEPTRIGAARWAEPQLRVDLDQPMIAARERVVDVFERAYLTQLLNATQNNVKEASRRSQIARRHLYTLLKKHGLRP